MTPIPIAPLHFTANERERHIALLKTEVQYGQTSEQRERAMDKLNALGIGKPKAFSSDEPPPGAA